MEATEDCRAAAERGRPTALADEDAAPALLDPPVLLPCADAVPPPASCAAPLLRLLGLIFQADVEVEADMMGVAAIAATFVAMLSSLVTEHSFQTAVPRPQ